MTEVGDISSGVTNSVDSESRTYVDPFESIGRPSDAAATSIADENSVFAMLKASLAALGVAAGTGGGAVNASPNVVLNPVATLGDVSDAAQSSVTATASVIALTKGVLALGGL